MCYVISYYIILYYIMYYIMLYYSILYYIVLYYIISYHIYTYIYIILYDNDLALRPPPYHPKLFDEHGWAQARSHAHESTSLNQSPHI